MHRQRIIWTIAALMLAATACEKNPANSEGESKPHNHASNKHAGEPPAPDDIPADQSWSGLTKNEDFYVTVKPDPNPIPFQELFSLKVKVLDPEDRETPIEGATLDEVSATMPAHDHGMKTDPEVVSTGPGAFRVDGMRFHMQGPGDDGRWVIHLLVNASGSIDRANFDVQCCRTE
jgi:hypothetical protein